MLALDTTTSHPRTASPTTSLLVKTWCEFGVLAAVQEDPQSDVEHDDGEDAEGRQGQVHPLRMPEKVKKGRWRLAGALWSYCSTCMTAAAQARQQSAHAERPCPAQGHCPLESNQQA